MDKALDFFKDQLRGIRHGDISPGLIDTVRVEAYDQKLPLKQLANVTPDKEGRLAVVPYDSGLLGAIDKALKAEGFNSYVFSKTQVVINRPVPTGEDKKRAIQQINKIAEEAKVAIRNIRKKYRQKAEDVDEIDKPLQKATDERIDEITKLVTAKVSSL